MGYYEIMNNKERTYQNKCHYCGCTPKNDEWSDRAKHLCIDCQDDEE
jgi:hypothetical protein